MLEQGEPRPDLQSALEAHLRRSPSGPDFGQSTINYLQEGLNLSVHKFSTVLRKQYPAEGTAIARQLHAARNMVAELPPSSLVQEASGMVVLVAPTSGAHIFQNRVIESIYHANPQLGAWEYAINLYPSKKPKYAHLHHPGFNMRFTNLVTHTELPLTSPEAQIMAVGYITQIAKLHGVAAVRKIMERAKVYAGIASIEFLDQHKQSLFSQVVDVKKHQAAITEGFATVERIAEQAELDEPEVRLLFDLAFLKGKAVDSPEEFQSLLRPIAGLIAKGDWEQAFQHRDFLLDYFIKAFPEWRQREYQTVMDRRSYESMAEVVRAVRRGELQLSEADMPTAYQPLFGDHLQRKVSRAENSYYREIIRQSVDLSNAILLGIGQSRGQFIDVPSPSGRSARELSRVRLADNRQVCDRYGAMDSQPINFGAILYTRIKNGLRYDEQYPDNYGSDAQNITRAIQAAYNQEQLRNTPLTYPLQDYLMALFQSGKGRLGETDSVVTLIRNL